jgi:hypothetical protein
MRQCEDVVLPGPVEELPGLPTLVQALVQVPDHRSRSGRRYGRVKVMCVTPLGVVTDST